MECEYCIGAGKVAMGKRLNNGKLSITIVRCKRCNGTGKKLTNADRIRAMSDEELAAWIASMTTVCECCAELNECEAPRGFNRCSHGVEDWLKQPYEGE